MGLFGYIRTSKAQDEGSAGMNPESQSHALMEHGVPYANLYHDIAISGITTAASRQGWVQLYERLTDGDILVVAALDRLGRQAIDVMRTISALHEKNVRLRSLALSEGQWVGYLDSEPGTPEWLIGQQILLSFTWFAQAEHEAISRRTKSGQARAKSQGKVIGRPSRITRKQLDAMIYDREVNKLGWGRLSKKYGHPKSTIADAIRRTGRN